MPAELRFELARVDRIAPVVARPIGHKADQVCVRRVGGLRHKLVQQRANATHDLQVRPLVAAAHVICLARSPACKHGADGRAVVAHKQPVAHLPAIAVNGQRLARERMRDDERNQLFRKVVGAVVVTAVGNQRRQPVGVVPGAHQVVACGLRRCVRAVGRVGSFFVKRRRVRCQGTIHLIGRDMQESERRACLCVQASGVLERSLQQGKGAVDVGAQKRFRPGNAAIDVRLRGEVDDCPRLVQVHQRSGPALVLRTRRKPVQHEI